NGGVVLPVAETGEQDGCDARRGIRADWMRDQDPQPAVLHRTVAGAGRRRIVSECVQQGAARLDRSAADQDQRQRRWDSPRLLWILNAVAGVADLQVRLSPALAWRHRNHRRIRLADISVTAAGNAPVPVRGCVRIDRIAGDDCVVADRWRRRAALETARRSGSVVDLDVERSSNMQHLTIATSSGIVWLTLVTHFGAALLALAAGTIALAVAKGGRLHK